MTPRCLLKYLIPKLYRDGYSVGEIANKAGCRPGTVRKYLQANGLLEIKERHEETVREMYQTGNIISEIAEHYGKSESSVRFRLRNEIRRDNEIRMEKIRNIFEESKNTLSLCLFGEYLDRYNEINKEIRSGVENDNHKSENH